MFWHSACRRDTHKYPISGSRVETETLVSGTVEVRTIHGGKQELVMKRNKAGNQRRDELHLDDIAHALNNKLTIICSRTELLLENEKLSDQVNDSLKRILSAGKQAVILANELTTP